LIFASEFNLFIPIKGHPFSAINRINDFFFKFHTISKSTTTNRKINPKPYTRASEEKGLVQICELNPGKERASEEKAQCKSAS
jgi:hypothetical protein